jgi:hypothetical protein
MKTYATQFVIKMKYGFLRFLLLFLFLFSIPLFAQITLNSSDIFQWFLVGNSTVVHEYDGSASVNIGNTDGGNNWDFTSLSEDYTYNLTSVDPASTPKYQEFTSANIATHEKANANGLQFEMWSYHSLDQSIFGNLGGVSVFNSDTTILKNKPAKIEVNFPATYNSSWSQTYTQSILVNGSESQSSIKLIVKVDAYGTMTLPGNKSYDALRLRETMTVNGLITNVSYFFISKDGAQVTLNAPANNDPSPSGTMSVESYSWNYEFKKSINIKKPTANELIISGEKYTIMWENADSVSIDYSIDGGNKWNHITNSNRNDYTWLVPKELLSRDGRIRVKDAINDDNFDIRPVRFKPWQLTRLDADNNYELFRVEQDGWSFPNDSSDIWPYSLWQNIDYQNGKDSIIMVDFPDRDPFNSAKASDFPSWKTFVKTFSDEQCYYLHSAPNPSPYVSEAIKKWGAIKDSVFPGASEGFAVSALLYFYHKAELLNKFPDIDDKDHLNSVSLNYAVQEAIAEFYTQQFGEPFSTYYYNMESDSAIDARELLQELKDMLSLENGDGKPLVYSYKEGSSSVFSVIPYKLERIRGLFDKDTPRFNLTVYNSDYPGSTNKIILIDSAENSLKQLNDGGKTTSIYKFYLGLESSQHLNVPQLAKAAKQTLAQTSPVEIYCPYNADINIVSEYGEIGFEDDSIHNTITKAAAIIPKTGHLHPPVGYYLPEGKYSASLSNTFGTPYLFYLTESTIYSYKRNNAAPDETDNISFTNGIQFENPDASVKNISIETIIDEKTSEKDFEADNISISGNDSINVKEMDRTNVMISNYGAETNYDLKIRSASADGENIFFHSSIQLSSNSSNQIVPDWNNLENGKVKILIDNGNDGTVDDSALISNETTEVKNSYSSNVPKAFNLMQNYPNPFNPSTTIKYEIPKQENVTLKVYNLLGEEVVTLVHGIKQSGSYKVHFDANNLSSGVYFYKLRAGSFVQTKKMILLR